MYPTTLHLIGGKGGDTFSFTGESNGASLEKISVWVGESQVKAVMIWLSDGRVEIFGKETEERPQEYTFQPGECFTSLSLWGNGAGTRLGAIKFKTNLEREFFSKMTKWGLKTEYPIDVGSGYCLGVEGRSGDDIDCMGFVFLNAVQSVVLTNVNYPTINQLMLEVAPEDIKSVTYRNASSITQNQNVETSKKIISKSSWSVSPSLSATFSVEVNAKIPFFAEGKTGFSVSAGIEGTYSREHTEERNETMSTSVNVPPGKKLAVVMFISRANLDLPYIGTMKITCKNGRVLAYETEGTYKGIAYAGIKVNTQESDLDITDKTDCTCHTHVR